MYLTNIMMYKIYIYCINIPMPDFKMLALHNNAHCAIFGVGKPLY